jgi:hypothetical protein
MNAVAPRTNHSTPLMMFLPKTHLKFKLQPMAALSKKVCVTGRKSQQGRKES